MKKITLSRLSLLNFKGIPDMALTLDGHSATVYGTNATGKTTIVDAFSWVLFGKDSRGHVPGTADFQIKPLDANGEVLNHEAVTEVEAVLEVDSVPVTLKRTYHEVWTKQRGRSTAMLSGHSSEFFVDGVPMKKNEFDERINALADEETFAILSDVTAFCEKLPEAQRRSILFDLQGDFSEEDVLASDPDLAPLAAELLGRPVESYRRVLASERRGLNTKQTTLPARMDECRRTVKEYRHLDFDDLRRQRESAAARRDEAKLLQGAASDTGRKLLESRRDTLSAQISELEQRNAAYRAAQTDTAARSKVDAELEQLERNAARMREDWEEASRENARIGNRIEEYRSQWRRIHAERFTGSDTCPTCGQTIPKAAMDMAKATFMAQRKERENSVAELAKDYTARQKEMDEKLSRLSLERSTVDSRLEELRGQRRQLAEAPVHDLPEYTQNIRRLRARLADTERQITEAQEDEAASTRQAKEQLRNAERELSRLDGLLAGEAVMRTAQARLQELEEETRRSAGALERCDALMELCDRFVTTKASFLSQRVNGLFETVGWTLFETQINGGVRDVCRATIGGVAYAGANTAARINAGMEIIRTISRARGVSVPLFVDNAEAVVTLADAGTQLIRLAVSGEDETIRVEADKE